MQLKPDITSENTHQQQTQHSNGAIQFDHVYFQYDQEYIINNLNLTIEPGAYIAIVGPSGSGKSTIANLLPRFYDVTSGSITINHQDIRTMPLEELRQKIGIVQQDVYIFSSTVYENIKYGNPEASMDEIIHASKLANAHEFIQQLPNGYHTQIGEKGAKLSGGQKQRLSIARMFLKNPEVVILDEATSSLDNLSEKVVQQSLEQLTLNRTTIVIAHRLSTIRNADNIYVLTKEGIIESGNHDTLIEKQGFYYRMYINEEN
nr:ATP-binding cassette domain-containing protein [Mammaliicoccus sciuri]